MSQRSEWDVDAALLYVVVDAAKGSKVVSTAKEFGIPGATIIRGRGTIRSGLLNALGVVDTRREVVLMALDMPTAVQILDRLCETLHFNRPNKGIAFMVRLSGFTGSEASASWPARPAAEPPTQSAWQLITVIVDRDYTETALDAARLAGSNGGTTLNGRGSGISQTSKLFDMEIEPEKSVVFMLVPAAQAPQIEQSIDEALQLDKPNSGILFTQEVIATRGIYTPKSDSDGQ